MVQKGVPLPRRREPRHGLELLRHLGRVGFHAGQDRLSRRSVHADAPVVDEKIQIPQTLFFSGKVGQGVREGLFCPHVLHTVFAQPDELRRRTAPVQAGFPVGVAELIFLQGFPRLAQTHHQAGAFHILLLADARGGARPGEIPGQTVHRRLRRRAAEFPGVKHGESVLRHHILPDEVFELGVVRFNEVGFLHGFHDLRAGKEGQELAARSIGVNHLQELRAVPNTGLLILPLEREADHFRRRMLRVCRRPDLLDRSG